MINDGSALVLVPLHGLRERGVHELHWWATREQ